MNDTSQPGYLPPSTTACPPEFFVSVNLTDLDRATCDSVMHGIEQARRGEFRWIDVDSLPVDDDEEAPDAK